MAATQISTFVNSEGKVVLAWSMPGPDTTAQTGAIALSPETALGLGRALVMRSAKALEVQDLFAMVEGLLVDAQASIEADPAPQG